MTSTDPTEITEKQPHLDEPSSQAVPQRTRLTVVFLNSKDQKKAPHTVSLSNPHEHFVLRVFRQFKASATPEAVDMVSLLWTQIERLKNLMDELLPSRTQIPHDFAGQVVDLFAISVQRVTSEPESLRAASSSSSTFLSVLLNVVIQDPQQQETFLSTLKNIGSTLFEHVNQIRAVVEDECKSEARVTELLQLTKAILRAGQLYFSSPTLDTFLDQPDLSFYIFRERGRTVYLIKNDTHWASMIQKHEVLRRGGKQSTAESTSTITSSKTTTSPPRREITPLCLTELRHLRTLYTRWQRNKKRWVWPDDVKPDAPPLVVRRMIREYFSGSKVESACRRFPRDHEPLCEKAW